MICRRHIRAKAPVLLLLGCAILLRLLIPTGWMPSATGGDFRIIPCSSWLADGGSSQAQTPHHPHDSAMVGGKHHSGPDGEHGSGKDQPCAFAGLAAAWTAADSTPIILPATMNLAVPLLHRAAAIGHGLAAPPPPSTGPPSLS